MGRDLIIVRLPWTLLTTLAERAERGEAPENYKPPHNGKPLLDLFDTLIFDALEEIVSDAYERGDTEYEPRIRWQKRFHPVYEALDGLVAAGGPSLSPPWDRMLMLSRLLFPDEVEPRDPVYDLPLSIRRYKLPLPTCLNAVLSPERALELGKLVLEVDWGGTWNALDPDKKESALRKWKAWLLLDPGETSAPWTWELLCEIAAFFAEAGQAEEGVVIVDSFKLH